MRFTQFGHHVPRRNSRINAPCSSRPTRVNVPSRLAAPREKSGARDPISRVSVRFCTLSSTLSEVEIRHNNGSGTGMAGWAMRWGRHGALTPGRSTSESDIIQLLILGDAASCVSTVSDYVSKSIKRAKDVLMPLTSIADIRGRQVLDSRGN